MAERKSVMLYLDSIEQWDMLSDEQAGALIKALLRYSKTGERIKTEDGMIAMAFSFIAAQIDRDGDKWEKRCEKNAESARKRWEEKNANASERMQMDANASERKKRNANDADTDTDTDTDTDIYILSGAADKQQPRTQFIAPSVEDVENYCKESGIEIDAQCFCDYYESIGWMVGKSQMKSWKAAARRWAAKDKADSKKRERKKPSRRSESSSFTSEDLEKLYNDF